VSIRETLLDEETVDWLKEQELLILAWVVDDGFRMNELVEMGVDAITTDNLAIMELLGGGERGERELVHRTDAADD
jgi:glycerophosphoryl diester phosphodiesterase